MSLIDGIIPPSAVEILVDRIGEIIVDELANQYVLTNDKLFQAITYRERVTPYQPEEGPTLNVFFERGEYSQQHQGQTNAEYRIIIEGFSNSKATGNTKLTRADILSMAKLKKLLMVCRYILEDPKYKMLAFQPGFIMWRHVENIWFQPETKQDSDTSRLGRLTYVVKVPEVNELINPPLIGGYSTTVRLYDTDHGYKWEYVAP